MCPKPIATSVVANVGVVRVALDVSPSFLTQGVPDLTKNDSDNVRGLDRRNNPMTEGKYKTNRAT